MKRLWRCKNPECECGEFVSPDPVCPGCGAGKDAASRDRFILALKPVHYDPPKFPGIGQHVKACDGKPWSDGVMATGSVDAVTCPVCRETGVWKDEKRKADEHPGYRVPDSPKAPPTNPTPAKKP